jgi:hypothetical protein
MTKCSTEHPVLEVLPQRSMRLCQLPLNRCQRLQPVPGDRRSFENVLGKYPRTLPALPVFQEVGVKG